MSHSLVATLRARKFFTAENFLRMRYNASKGIHDKM